MQIDTDPNTDLYYIHPHRHSFAAISARFIAKYGEEMAFRVAAKRLRNGLKYMRMMKRRKR